MKKISCRARRERREQEERARQEKKEAREREKREKQERRETERRAREEEERKKKEEKRKAELEKQQCVEQKVYTVRYHVFPSISVFWFHHCFVCLFFCCRFVNSTRSRSFSPASSVNSQSPKLKQM